MAAGLVCWRSVSWLVGWMVGLFSLNGAIPRPACTYSGLRSHLTSLMYMNLMTERADMPYIVACMFQSLILVAGLKLSKSSQKVKSCFLAALQRLKNKQPLMHQPVMRSINIHGPSCKDGGKWQPFWWG